MTSLNLLVMAAALSLPVDDVAKNGCAGACCKGQAATAYRSYAPAQNGQSGYRVYSVAPGGTDGATYGVYRLPARYATTPAGVYAMAAQDSDDSIATRIRAPRRARQAQNQAQAQNLPDTWIGVRMSPVPAPLAAHVGDQGMMVANVVKDSPADKAGLQQYDVITQFNDVKIVTNEDLVNAVQGAGRGTAKVRIIRGGKNDVVGIKPAKRPDTPDVTYKYDEPFDAITNSNMQFRGHMLTPGQNGAWMLRDLGDLENLPKGLNQFFHNFDFDGGDFEIDLGDLGAGHTFMFRADEGQGDGQVEIRVKTVKDGQTIVVERDADGRIGVTRTDENGDTTTENYENMEELREADEEAANMIGQHGGLMFRGGAGAHGFGGPFKMKMQSLPKLRMQWQADVDKALQDVRQQLKNARIEIRSLEEDGAGGQVKSQAIAVKINDDGVVVTTTEDGETVEHRYESMDDLKQSDPDLYDRVRAMFGDDGGI